MLHARPSSQAAAVALLAVLFGLTGCPDDTAYEPASVPWLYCYTISGWDQTFGSHSDVRAQVAIEMAEHGTSRTRTLSHAATTEGHCIGSGIVREGFEGGSGTSISSGAQAMIGGIQSFNRPRISVVRACAGTPTRCVNGRIYIEGQEVPYRGDFETSLSASRRATVQRASSSALNPFGVLIEAHFDFRASGPPASIPLEPIIEGIAYEQLWHWLQGGYSPPQDAGLPAGVSANDRSDRPGSDWALQGVEGGPPSYGASD